MLMAGPVPAIDVFDRRSEPIVDVRHGKKIQIEVQERRDARREGRKSRASAEKGEKSRGAPNHARSQSRADNNFEEKAGGQDERNRSARRDKSGAENGQSGDESEDDIGGARREAGEAPPSPKPVAAKAAAAKPAAVEPAALKAAAEPSAPKPAASKPAAPVRASAAPAKPAARASGKPRYYITTAISYPNGVPHIGHAYEAIATDAIARFMRLDGYDVFFLTGTDEHGIKMHQTAGKENLTPRELVERNVPRFQAMVKRLNLSNDEFIRTTEDRHHQASIGIWDKMAENGDIYLDKYAGWYSVRDEAYYDEQETRLNEHGVRLGPQGTPVEWVEEESYFFKLSAYQDKLLELYQRPDYVLPKERLNEVMSFVKGGLQDLSISRTTFDWGVKVPRDPKHVMYVWVDALTNYITAVGYPDTESEKFKRYWPADLHVIGKDIVRFHAVYWPAFLMSAGIEVPRRIFSHGFLFNRGEKMSKSVGNVIDPFALCDAYGVDQVRYFFLREVPFGQDGTYSHEAIVNRINADLANDLGNLAQRSLTMVARRFNSALPAARIFQPGRRGDAQRCRQHDRQGATLDEDAAAASCADLRLDGRGARQSVLHRAGAVGAGQDRSGAAGHRAVRHRGGRPSGRHSGAAVHAGIRWQTARSDRGAGDRAWVRDARQQPADHPRKAAADAGAGVPALC